MLLAMAIAIAVRGGEVLAARALLARRAAVVALRPLGAVEAVGALGSLAVGAPLRAISAIPRRVALGRPALVRTALRTRTPVVTLRALTAIIALRTIGAGTVVPLGTLAVVTLRAREPVARPTALGCPALVPATLRTRGPVVPLRAIVPLVALGALAAVFALRPVGAVAVVTLRALALVPLGTFVAIRALSGPS